VNPVMNPPHRRGACPGLTAPMQTGDGLLVRLAGAGATIGLDAAAALCAAARRHGNGIIEVTARGSIQIRGLTAASAPAFADTVAALGIDAGEGVPILVDPLAGIEPAQTIDARSLAGELRQRLAAASFADMLGPKVSVVIDGGSALHLDAIRADIRLRACSGPATGAVWHVGLGGDAASAMPAGAVAPANAVEIVARLLETIAQHGPQARARDLIHLQGPDAFRTAITDFLIEAPGPTARPQSDPIGTHRLRDGHLGLGIGLAFGHTDADALDGLIEAAARAGASGLRTAPGRALLVIGLPADASPALAAKAESLGFITRRDDPRRNVVACAGAPICASAEIPARALAPLISSAAASLLDGSLTIHLSGCPKGCAHPGPSGLTIVGRQNGCGLIVDGSARDHPGATIVTTALPSGLARIAREVARAGGPEETSAATLARLGAARLATIFGAARHE
jgi:precorrin-3B synthase